MAVLAAAIALAVLGQDTRRTSLTGDVRHIEGFESKVLGNKRNLIIWLPPGYGKDAKAKYPVVYMHDGQNVMDGATSFIANEEWRADEAAQGMCNAGITKPFIIVGIDNAGTKRAYEYLPTKAKFGDGEDGGGADLYSKFVMDEVMPYIESHYQVATGPQNTAVIGSSFGGIVSLWMGLKHPERIGMVGVCSPSFWWDDHFMTKQLEALKAKPKLKVWMDCGNEEGGDMLVSAMNAASIMKKKGWGAKDLRFYVDGHAQHNERAWAGRLPMIFEWFFGR